MSLVALCALVLLTSGCGDAGAPDGTTIAVGAVLPLSGENASFGATSRAAFEIAQADAAAAGRLALDVRYGDSQLQTSQALTQWQRLVREEGVVAFVEVTGSGIALALAQIAERDQVPIVSGINTSPELTTGGGGFFFRVIPSDAYSAQVLSDWAIGDGLSQAALIYNQQNGWATGFHAAVTGAYPDRGGSLPAGAVLTVTDATVDFGPAIATLRNSQPQAVFVGLMGRQAGLFVRQAVDKGLLGPFFGVDNLAQQEFIEAAGPAASYARMVLPSQTSSDRASRFAEAFQARTGRAPDALAYAAYDSYLTLLAAIEAVHASGEPVTGAAIRNALVGIQVEGLTGSIAFDDNHDLREASYERFSFTADGSQIPFQPGN
jgi:branched-chain amino acid transport system substrate-binding protein